MVDLDPIAVDMANHYWYIDADRAKKELEVRFRDPIATITDTVDYIKKRNPEL